MRTTWWMVGALVVLAACGSSTETPAPPVVPPGSGGAGGAGGAGGGPGVVCGGETCDPGERCYQTCDGGPSPACGLPNITCGEFDFGACGCDGVAYEDRCALDEAGVRTGGAGSCTPPAGQFDCGGLLCRIDDQVCSFDTSPFCYGKASTCADCSCVDVDEVCPGGGTCEVQPGGGIVVDCGGT